MAIVGKKRLQLTPETVLSMISSFDIFRLFMPDKFWKINHAMNSPLRKDENPSWILSNRGGHLHFIDYGNGDHGDCFEFTKKMFSLSSMDDVLHKIDDSFGLGISSCSKRDYKKIISEYKQPEELGKRYSLIQIETRKFTEEELAYWESYHQTIEDLRREKIYSIKNMYLNRIKYPLDDSLVRFSYFYDGFWKLYVPYADKKKKWLSNVPITILDGIEDIQHCDTLFITKSKKDKMVLKKIYPNVISTQKEGLECFSQENVKIIKEKSNKQIIMYDSDVAGVRSSLEITKLFGFGYCNVPRRYLSKGIKDYADWSKIEGYAPIKTHFLKKGL